MTTLHSERQRRRYGVRTDCVATADGGAPLLGDRVRDLSWDGAFLECEPSLSPGQGLRLSIRIPDSRVWVDARATVTRVSAGRRGGGDARGLGLRITAMDGMSRVLLASVLRRYPPVASSGRGPARDYAGAVARIAAR